MDDGDVQLRAAARRQLTRPARHRSVRTAPREQEDARRSVRAPHRRLRYRSMRLREAAWRRLGPACGRLAPAASRAYYDAVTRSLVESFARIPGVRSVYAGGSYALDRLELGRSA